MIVESLGKGLFNLQEVNGKKADFITFVYLQYTTSDYSQPVPIKGDDSSDSLNDSIPSLPPPMPPLHVSSKMHFINFLPCHHCM